MCFLSNDIHDYYFVSQGKVTVASIDDNEEMQFTDVSCNEEERKKMWISSDRSYYSYHFFKPLRIGKDILRS